MEGFHRRLEYAGHPQNTSKSHAGGVGYTSSFGSVGSPGLASSPKSVMKSRKVSGQMGNVGVAKGVHANVGRAEVNMKDHVGLTILHRAVSSTSANANKFALALIEHPMIDLYIQDLESGWTALHRALYFGNITIARAIMERDRRDPTGLGGNVTKAGASVIKIKDHEGNSPFDVYNATIARRSLQKVKDAFVSGDNSDEEDDSTGSNCKVESFIGGIEGDELYVFGSNKNHSLGFGDGDDRQHPEKITLKRPDHLLFRFYQEYLDLNQFNDRRGRSKPAPKKLADIPSLILNRPIIIHDVSLSKLSSAVLTTDPEANLYMCGFGPGGRLGMGDEVTRFTYTCVEVGGLSGKKVEAVALGQNHTLAVSSEGEVFSWGTSTYGQLGYNLPRPASIDEEPICTLPRQIFGPLKREYIIGVAASAIHSVAHTSTSLFCWGKNEGQLGLMDSDSRSLSVQPVPRRVAASLFKAPIKMVSAINGATICLLANHTVCVFTNYGYNIVKYPLFDSFNNKSVLTTRYDAGPSHISSIAAGGDTIAAISSRGDLFTMSVKKIDIEGPSSSTTNPSKIKSSLSVPQKVWSQRKGHWDGIKSVGVAENGSVIVCTQAGAVWRRVRRATIKDAFTESGSSSHKNFKFQRVPGLTSVAAVRSTPFGVFAAIRRDCDVTKTQIHVEEQSLWQHVRPLLSVGSIELSKLPASLDVEADVEKTLLATNKEHYNMEIRSSTSEVCIPTHAFMLASRSHVFRKALEEFRLVGSASVPELFTINLSKAQPTGVLQPLLCVTFHGTDFLSVLNLLIYIYTDQVVDFWHFTRQYPNMGFRYRQVRVELMKMASHLKMPELESAVRLMTDTEKCMDMDMDIAIQEQSFFRDGDTLIELDGEEILSHSTFLCQRCPFFDGLFNGRSGGQWLVGRRTSSAEVVRIDLKHLDPLSFKIVLRYLYADVGTELFDDVVTADIDEFSELVIDVLSIADELMLDRLSQICQEVLGRFVNSRNASQLLNVIAPCSVTDFRDATLEYICLQLEFMLENHLIDNLDDDLLLDLDEVVRGNQLSCLPFAKSGRAELLLHERYPELAEEIDEERKRRVRDSTFRAGLRDYESRLSTSFRAHSVDDIFSGSPGQDTPRRKSKAARNAPFSPSIRPKESANDLIFDMDDEDTLFPASSSSLKSNSNSEIKEISRVPSTPSVLGSLDNRASISPSRNSRLSIRNDKSESPSTSTAKWSSPKLSSSKLDMREIMAQTSSSRVSNLSMSLSEQRVKDQATTKSANKLSQKERKKQLQQEALQLSSQPLITVDNPDGKPSSPWQVAATGRKTSLKDIFSDTVTNVSSSPLSTNALNSPAASRSHTPRRAPSPDTRFAGQQRSSSAQSKYQPASTKSPLMIAHSKSYTTPTSRAEPSLQLSMSDIIGQQRREQEVIKEAAAKRSLQEIQEEQAFQEWWDQESKRAQEEEATRANSSATASSKGAKSSRGKSSSKTRGGRGRGSSNRGGKGRGEENLGRK